MMPPVRLVPFVAGAMLAACSPSAEQAEAPVPAASQPARSTQVVAPAPADASGAGRSTNLTGRVSGLTGDTSGLNVRQSDLGTVVELPSDTLFAFDSAELGPQAEASLAKAADLIRAAPAGDIAIIGHTDAKGDDAYNRRLSQQRAQAVADWMGQQVGVRQRRLDVSGRGETEPVAPNARPDGSDDPDGRARNRRVDVVIPD